jgi:hypothetical protein
MPMTAEAIALEIAASLDHTRNLLRAMELSGRVLNLGRGNYSPDRGGFCIYGSAVADR